MKNIGVGIFLWFFICDGLYAQFTGFRCREVTPEIRFIEYLTDNPAFTFQASDAVILKGDGGCFGSEIIDDKIKLKRLNVFIQVPEEKNGFQIFLGQGEEIYGGGERALAHNRRGYAFPLNNNPWYGYGYGADHLNYSVPFFISSRGYGVFFDNPSKGFIDIGKKHQHIMDVRFTGGALHLYIIEGKNPEEILERYYDLTGTQEMVPKWAMGLFMSRFGYTSESQVMDIAKTMDKKKIPFDAVIFDLFWFGDSIKSSMGNLDWVNTTAWPNPKKMISQLSAKGRKSILITEPFVLETSKNFEEATPFFSKNKQGEPHILQDFYFGRGGLLDLYRRDAREWFLSKYEAQIENGVAGWWGDLGEPEKHPEDMMHDLSDLDYSNQVPATAVHNLYGQVWTKTLYEYYKQKNPRYKLFNLNRAGFAGSQRYGIIPWTGDVSRSWDGFKAQIPLLTGMSMSGVPYIHSDAGGFAGGEKDDELYARWFQMAVFTPILRPHGTAVYDRDTSAVSYPSEPALIEGKWEKTIHSYAKLRYEMLPYNYNLSFRHYRFGEPLLAPMWYYYPDDEKCRAIEDQYFWGKDIIVAPVMNKNQEMREVYLPDSCFWYPLQARHYQHNMQKAAGLIAWPVVDQSMPVFVKEGSFMVLNSVKEGRHSADFDEGDVEIHYYFSPGNTGGEWYDDEGNNRLAIKEGLFDWWSFLMNHDNPETSRLILSSIRNTGTGWRPNRKAKLFFHGMPKDFILRVENGANLKADKGFYAVELKHDKPLLLELIWK